MKLKAAAVTVLILVLACILIWAFTLQPVKGNPGTIYIRANGSVDPSTANIASADNVTYVFTGDIEDSLVIQRGNITIDGAGYTLQGTGSGTGIDIWVSGFQENVTLKNMEIVSFDTGVWLSNAANVTVSGNAIRNCSSAIAFGESWDNVISGNFVTNNTFGIRGNTVMGTGFSGNLISNNAIGILLRYAQNNSIYLNNITNNEFGVYVEGMYVANNTFYHNNLVNNTNQVFVEEPNPNTWDDGLPSGGNYWSNYAGVDSDYDGIGDSWYNITQANTDHYPLMGLFSDFPVTHQESSYHVTTICNSVISEFQLNGTAISFNVAGPNYTVGFCRVTIPNNIVQDLWQDSIRVLVDGEEPIMTSNWTDGTYTYVYFKYLHSEHKIEIIPEFQTWISVPLLLTVLSFTIIFYKKQTPKH